MRFQKGFGYEYFLRPNYELLAFFIWVCGGLFAWWMKDYAAYPLPWAFRIWLGFCLVVPHPVFWTQVIIKPPELERLGRATGAWPARGF